MRIYRLCCIIHNHKEKRWTNRYRKRKRSSPKRVEVATAAVAATATDINVSLINNFLNLRSNISRRIFLKKIIKKLTAK